MIAYHQTSNVGWLWFTPLGSTLVASDTGTQHFQNCLVLVLHRVFCYVSCFILYFFLLPGYFILVFQCSSLCPRRQHLLYSVLRPLIHLCCNVINGFVLLQLLLGVLCDNIFLLIIMLWKFTCHSLSTCYEVFCMSDGCHEVFLMDCSLFTCASHYMTHAPASIWNGFQPNVTRFLDFFFASLFMLPSLVGYFCVHPI